MGEQFDTANELNMSIQSDIEHHVIDVSEEAKFQETSVAVIGPTILDFNDDILSIEYESISYGFNVTMGLDVARCVEFETFSFDPILTDLLFKSDKSKFVEFETFVPMIADLDQTPRMLNLQNLWALHPLFCLDCSL